MMPYGITDLDHHWKKVQAKACCITGTRILPKVIISETSETVKGAKPKGARPSAGKVLPTKLQLSSTKFHCLHWSTFDSIILANKISNDITSCPALILHHTILGETEFEWRLSDVWHPSPGWGQPHQSPCISMMLQYCHTYQTAHNIGCFTYNIPWAYTPHTLQAM